VLEGQIVPLKPVTKCILGVTYSPRGSAVKRFFLVSPAS